MKRLSLLVFVLVAVLVLKRTVRLRRKGLALTADYAERDAARGLALAGVAFVGIRVLTGSDVAAAILLLVALWASGVASLGFGELGLSIPAFPFGGGGDDPTIQTGTIWVS